MAKQVSSDFAKLEVGMTLDNKDCILTEQKENGGFIRAILIDSTGTVPCSINKDLIRDFSIFGAKEVTVRINGVYTYKKGEKNLWVTALEKSDAKISRPEEQYLSPEKVDFYMDWFKVVDSKIHHPGYKKLLTVIFTDEFLKSLYSLPATLAAGGQYQGGALQMTATVLRFCAMCGCDYVKFGNDVYTKSFDFDALFTAAFVQLYGNIVYYYPDEEQGKILKTANGLNAGYYATLAVELKKIITENDIPITEAEYSFLLNILGSSVRNGRNGVQPVSAEGALLRAMNDAFVALDMYNAEYQRLTKVNTGDYGENAPYLYSDRLDAYIVVGQKPKEEEPEERKEGNG